MVADQVNSVFLPVAPQVSDYAGVIDREADEVVDDRIVGEVEEAGISFESSLPDGVGPPGSTDSAMDDGGCVVVNVYKRPGGLEDEEGILPAEVVGVGVVDAGDVAHVYKEGSGYVDHVASVVSCIDDQGDVVEGEVSGIVDGEVSGIVDGEVSGEVDELVDAYFGAGDDPVSSEGAVAGGGGCTGCAIEVEVEEALCVGCCVVLLGVAAGFEGDVGVLVDAEAKSGEGCLEFDFVAVVRKGAAAEADIAVVEDRAG